MKKIERESHGNFLPGQELVIAGYAGLAGSQLMLNQYYHQLLEHFSFRYLNQIRELNWNLETKTADFWSESGAGEWELAGKGGIMTALWNLSGAYETGFEIELSAIPVHQVTVELCELMDLNPYRLYSRGCVLLAADHGYSMVRALSAAGIPGTVIGTVSDNIARVVRNEGGMGYLERPQPEELGKLDFQWEEV